MTNKELISKSEVEKILKHWFPMHGHGENYYFIEQIKSLPTFSPEAIIEEMIEKLKNTQFLAMIDKKIEENLYEEVHTIDVLRKFRSDVEKMEDNIVSKTHALGFAYWYHNGLTNGERGPVEEEFDKYMNETI